MRRYKLANAPNKTRIALPHVSRKRAEITRISEGHEGVLTFLELTDTPAAYVGHGGDIVMAYHTPQNLNPGLRFIPHGGLHLNYTVTSV